MGENDPNNKAGVYRGRLSGALERRFLLNVSV